MKKVIIMLLVVLSPVWLLAQNSKLNDFFNKYSGQEGYTSVYITKYMFELFAKISDEQEDKEFKELTSNLNSIKILTADSLMEARNGGKFQKELLQILPKTNYKELMIIKEGKQDIRFLIREEKSKISELVMIVTGQGEPVLIFLEGDINLKNISKLSKSMKIKGFEHLEKIDD